MRAASNNQDGLATFDLGTETAAFDWSDFVRGVTWVLAQEGFPISGFDVLISSDVPIGAGLSSSAALEVSLLKALKQAFSLNLDEVRIARLGQRVENDFVGARVGIMDQMISSLGHFGEAVFIDTKKMTHRRIELPVQEMDLLVIDSGVKHNNSGGDYNQRRSECEQACAALGIQELREMTSADLPKINQLPDTLARRARHVVTENERVLKAVEALEKRDFVGLGRLFNESHVSMRDDYQVSVPEIDQLVELALSSKDVFGARLTGGGFGGSIVALTRKGCAQAVGTKIIEAYREITGKTARLLVPR